MGEQSSELVGRGAELAAWDAALDTLRRGRFLAIELSGEPGIGKSRLLAEFGSRADARGMLVLSGAASEFERDLPFWLFVDALDEYLRALEPHRLDGLGAEDRAELAQVLPSWPTAAPAGAAAGTAGQAQPDHRYRTHRAVRRVLELLAADGPVVLLLDDLHWADSGSTELLSALLRRPPAAPVLIGMALRPRQVADRLAGELTRSLTAGVLSRLELGRLTLDDCCRLLGPDVDSRHAASLHAASGGNPFYLRQLAQAGRTPGAASAVVPLDGDVPLSVATAISDELALLGSDTRRVLEGAAVAGDPFTLELAAAASALPESAVTGALDDLQRRDLVGPTDVPRRFRFRHPLLRRAVYASTPGAWRVGAHERCAEWLGARGVSEVTRAHHVIQSARRGDRTAIELLRATGDAVVHRAPAEGAHWFRSAIDLLPDSAPVEALPLWMALAGALGAAGRLVDARAAQLYAIELVPAADTALRGQLVANCAGIEHTLGFHDAAHRRLVAAVDELPEPNTAQRASLLNALAVDHLYRSQFAVALDWSRRAHATGRLLDDPVLRAEAATGLALTAGFGGAATEAADACTEAAALVDGLTDEQIGHSADPIAVRLGAAELFVDRYQDAARHAERGLAVAQALGSGEHVPVLFWTGTVRAALGRLRPAATLLDKAIEVARSSDNPSMLGWALTARSLVATASGDTDRALATAAEGVDAHRESASSMPSAWAGYALAAALLQAGDPAAADQILLTSAGDQQLSLLLQPLRPAAFELLTRCHLALGNPAAARSAAAAAGQCAAESGLITARAAADRAAAAVALESGDARRAADLALAAAAGALAVGALSDAAAARELAGRALGEAGTVGVAVAELERAAAEFEGCGASRRRAAVERQLRRLGHRRLHHRTRPGNSDVGDIESLTERELEIARLVTDRRTNTEIASGLFLSRKTVETHIRNIFRKLGVSSRVDIARAVEDFDRAGGRRHASSSGG